MKRLIFISIIILGLTKLFCKDMFISDKIFQFQVEERISIKEKQKQLDKIYSSKKLGAFVENNKTIFRLFTPNAEEVSLVIFENVEDTVGFVYDMIKDENSVWEVILNEEMYGKYYNFLVKHKDKEPVLCLDPYAKAVASFNTYFTPRKGIIIKENNFDWEGDTWIRNNWRDLIIYEMHIRDMTEHPSSGVENRGTYLGLTEKNKKGGLSYIKNLGVNAVELLPSMEFANVEIPYRKEFRGRFNTWNPYERNHWGYMTAAFFAPEEYYSINTRKLEKNKWSGADARQVNDFKEMVKAFHKEGIAVLMDVVFNHLSEYEFGNLKEIDKEYYFRLDDDGNFIAESYCGNDLRTEAPMLRRLIVESVLYWMQEYHIDGFRFDLGKLLDWETIETVIYEAKKINPDVVFVCEPWGGGYDPAGFSLRGWGAWNDQIRNGIKGENPYNGLGWIFGSWYGNNNPQRIKSYVRGTLVNDEHGLFQKPEHSVNYLESHDGYTLGDFIRIGLRYVDPHIQKIKNVDEFVKLDEKQLKINKLAAMFLFTSQGIIMIHSGQEFARTKVIPFNSEIPDTNQGKIDHNSYDKDNEVNYINYNHPELNSELLNFYKKLIELRKKHPALRRAGYEEISFISDEKNPFAIAFVINHANETIIVAMNADNDKDFKFELKEKFEILLSTDAPINKINNQISLKPKEGIILKKIK
ncbi:MAG: alpha-amylase family glycosyl hydrolase [Ignavibacterium sp.]|nr:alpha-amylase family glycosyl hydrolase [Ignavibacterium sp.]MCX7611324.1 alpha-amylase family glycosyl hydrolase [Ignavibacterium sp.]MDW8375991.1 alpha-amylase family glycosyl hydrolase [Ignavibacteriales bacterium]